MSFSFFNSLKQKIALNNLKKYNIIKHIIKINKKVIIIKLYDYYSKNKKIIYIIFINKHKKAYIYYKHINKSNYNISFIINLLNFKKRIIALK